MMANLLKISFLLIFTLGFCQKNSEVREISKEDLKLKSYEKDSLANALVLYESANLYIDEENDFNFRTDYFYRIKIFNRNAYSKADINIPLYGDQKAINIKALSYNIVDDEIVKTQLKSKAIFKLKRSELWNEIKFTIPKINDGVVIEYSYSILSPYSQLDDWYFQSDIPKLKSEFNASILGNYQYNIRLFGSHPLSKNEQSRKRNCIYIPNLGNGGCAMYSLAMETIPAFKTEAHMLNKKNYMSRLVWDLISFTNIYGRTAKYTNSWENADESLKEYFLDDQVDKTRFFKRQIPEDILNSANDLSRAKDVYNYMKQRLTWNGENRSYNSINVKEVYKNRIGSADALNLVLYNGLKSAGIKAYLVALSTRENGLVTKIYPNIKDFNYFIIKVDINQKSYLLDITDKHLSFGQIPFKCLNGEGRVIDLEKESYWVNIASGAPSFENIKVELDLNEKKDLGGKMIIIKNGYFALEARKKINNKTDQAYQNYFQNLYPNLIVKNYEAHNKLDARNPLIQRFDISFDVENNNQILFNPFIIKKIDQNPFSLDNRNYPVNFGFAKTLVYSISITIPEDFEVLDLPENKKLSLPDSGGNFLFKVSQQKNKISLLSKLSLTKPMYMPDEYQALKDFFDKIIEAESIYLNLKNK